MTHIVKSLLPVDYGVNCNWRKSKLCLPNRYWGNRVTQSLIDKYGIYENPVEFDLVSIREPTQDELFEKIYESDMIIR